ncbi:hypothetical protein D3C75_1179580 [compost metagenome]
MSSRPQNITAPTSPRRSRVPKESRTAKIITVRTNAVIASLFVFIIEMANKVISHADKANQMKGSSCMKFSWISRTVSLSSTGLRQTGT